MRKPGQNNNCTEYSLFIRGLLSGSGLSTWMHAFTELLESPPKRAATLRVQRTLGPTAGRERAGICVPVVRLQGQPSQEQAWALDFQGATSVSCLTTLDTY